MSSLSEGFQSGLQIARDSRLDRAGEEDRKLMTEMRRMQVENAKKDIAINEEVNKFDISAQEGIRSLDSNSLGYGRDVIGVIKSGMQSMSPAARAKALPQVKMLYDQFDATSKVEAEMDQRAALTDYRRAFSQDAVGISFPDIKLALKAKQDFGVDPVFAEKDGISVFDRKGTQAAVDVEQAMRAKSAGNLAGLAKLAQDEVGDTRLLYKAKDDAATAAALEASQNDLRTKREGLLYDLTEKRKISESETRFAETFKNEFSGAAFAAPKSQLDRQALLEYKVALPGEEMPMAGASPNYPEMRKRITAKVNADKVAFEKSMTEAKQKKEPVETPPHVAQYAKDAGASVGKSQEYSAKLEGYMAVFNNPKVGMDEKLATARSIMKLFNSALVGSPDAVAAQEAKFLGDELEFKQFNTAGFFDKSQVVRGQNFPLFLKKVETMKDILDSSAERSRTSAAWASKEKEIPSANDVKIAMGETPNFQNEKAYGVWKSTPRGSAYGGRVIVGGNGYSPKRTGTTGPATTPPTPQGAQSATPRAALPTQDQRRAGQIAQVKKDIEELKSKESAIMWIDKRNDLRSQIETQENILKGLLSK